MDLPLESRCKLVTDIYKISRDVMLSWFDSARSGDLKTMKRLFKNVTMKATTNEQHPLIHARGDGTSYGFVGSTVLHWAAANGDIPMMKQLFECGASPNAQNKGGSTPLHSACSNLRAESASLLLQKGANPDLSDCCNDTPLDILKNILRSEAAASDEDDDEQGFDNKNSRRGGKAAVSTSSIAKQINKMLQVQSLALKMCSEQANSASKKKDWDVTSMKKLVVGCGFFSREEECPKEREELAKVCDMALGHFSLQLDLAANSDSAFEKLKAGFDEKLQQRAIAVEKKMNAKKNKMTRARGEEEEEDYEDDDDDEEAELQILQQKAKQTSDKGNQAFNQGEYKLAVQMYTAAISLAAHDATYYSNRAAAYLRMKVPKKALADAKTAASLKPEWAKPYHRWGSAALDLGLLSDAVAAFKLGLEKAPGDASLLSGMDAVMVALEEKRGRNVGATGEGRKEQKNNNNNNRDEENVDSDDNDDDFEDFSKYKSSSGSRGISSTANNNSNMSDTAAAFIPIVDRKPWFECRVCENRTRDSAETTCCHKQLCGTCAKKSSSSSVTKCPFKCGK